MSSNAEEPRSPVPPPRATVVLATLNEGQNLPEVLDRLLRLPYPGIEVIVVDDGSTDGTREHLTTVASRDPRVRSILHEGKQTTLRAQCQGIEAAHGAYVCIMDADLQHPPEMLMPMLQQLEGGASLVVASRYAAGGTAGPRSAYRWLLSRGAEWIARLFLPSARGVSDPVSGFFAFRREIWIPLNPLYRGYKLLLFALVMAEGQRLSEVGFRFEPRGEGTSKVTGSLAFVRVFATEVLLAARLRKEVRHRARRAGLAAKSLA